MLNYVKRHWRGEQSLGWSFWINLVALRIGVFAIQDALAPAEGSDHHAYRTLIITAIAIIHIGFLVWQLVGVFRAAETHYSENGNMALVWGAQLGSVLMFMLSAVYAMGAVQMSRKAPEQLDTLAMMSAEHASRYTLRVSPDKQSVHVTGNIELGITHAVRKLLADYPLLKSVVLDSAGGNIYEGRGLAKLFASHELNTHVDATCASACTVAYVGGTSRSAGAEAVFGFHQYRIDADYTIIAVDIEKEQQRDQQLFLNAGVADQFVRTVFTQPSVSMWWPDREELVRAGFVHNFTDQAEE